MHNERLDATRITGVAFLFVETALRSFKVVGDMQLPILLSPPLTYIVLSTQTLGELRMLIDGLEAWSPASNSRRI